MRLDLMLEILQSKFTSIRLLYWDSVGTLIPQFCVPNDASEMSLEMQLANEHGTRHPRDKRENRCCRISHGQGHAHTRMMQCGSRGRRQNARTDMARRVQCGTEPRCSMYDSHSGATRIHWIDAGIWNGGCAAPEQATQ